MKFVALTTFFLAFCIYGFGQNPITFSVGSDLVSRYNWRGLDIGNAAAFQPSLSMTKGGFEAGFWGSYSLDRDASDADELDLWFSYTAEMERMDLTFLVTDYYFPNAGIEFGNFNDYDDEDGAGAHTMEAGLSFGFKNVPLTLSAYYNFHNDAGNNTYFQLDYEVKVNDSSLQLFCGATGGSDENPDYYGADSFAVINVGVRLDKEFKFNQKFSLPVFTSFIYNPEQEQAYLVFGMSF